MSNFLILFDEKEGTSHLMVLLSHFTGVSVVHQTDNQGWEPFDSYVHGSLSTKVLMQCMDLDYSSGDDDLAQLNRIYTRTSDRPIDHFDKSADIGFKMRFYPPQEPGFLTRSRIAVGHSKAARYSR